MYIYMYIHIYIYIYIVIGDFVVSVATRIYDGPSVVRIPAGATRLSLFQNIFTGCGSLFCGCRGSSPGVNWLGRDIDHSTVSSAWVKNECRYTSAPLTALRGVDWDKSTFLPYYEGWNFNSGNYLFTTDTK